MKADDHLNSIPKPFPREIGLRYGQPLAPLKAMAGSIGQATLLDEVADAVATVLARPQATATTLER